ncbi:hypothetical protein GGI21_000303 [Coemansia aciculifera]|nr:hypothetical protein GGI21_000303 [Coemansia aciculifera]
MARNSGTKISAMFVVLAAVAASANSQGIWDGYALPHAAIQPAASNVPGSYRAWLDHVRPQQQRPNPNGVPLFLEHHMRNAQDDYTTYDGGEPKYSETSVEPTTEEPQPSYEAPSPPPPPYPVYPTAVYKSTEPYVCPPVEHVTVTATVTCTVTEPAPPPVTVTSVCTVTETTTVEVTHEAQPYYTPYVAPAPYTQAEYYTTTTPVYAAPAYTAPVYTAPVYTAPAYAAPAYTAPVYTAPVYTAPAYAAPAYTAPVYAAPVYTAPVYTAPAYAAPAPVYPALPPVYASPPYSAPEPSTTPYSSSSSPTPYSSSSPAYSATSPTYAHVSESTSTVTVTHTSVSTATYTSVMDAVSEVTVTETSYPVVKKHPKHKKAKKVVAPHVVKQEIPSNPWIRVVPNDEPVARVAAEDIGLNLMQKNIRRNA